MMSFIFIFKLQSHCNLWYLLLVVGLSATSSSVSTIANQISSASVTCTDTQKTSLKSLEDDVETLQTSITTKLSTVQSLLEGK